MGSRVVTALLRSIGARIADTITTKSTSMFIVRLSRLRRSMWLVEAVMEDVMIQSGEEEEEGESLWLKKLKDVTREAEEVLRKYAYEVLLTNVQSCNPIGAVGSELKSDPATLAALHKLAARLGQIRQDFEALAEDWEASPCSLTFQPSATINDYLSHKHKSVVVFGRDNDKEAIITLLLSADATAGAGAGASASSRSSAIQVLPILGLAGVGKTTIADSVYKDSRIRQHHDLLAWVYVPKDFNIRALTNNIVQCFTGNSCNLSNVILLQEKLSEIVTDKVFFLVLDNVQTETRSLWEFLLAPFHFAQSGTIILTTRSESVARITQTIPPYLLGCLSFEDSCSMFSNIAFEFNNINEKETLLAMSEHIVKRCTGLPLAVKALASNLQFAIDKEEWRDMLEVKQQWFSNPILGILKNSYDRMSFKVKQCLQISTLYPKGFIFYKEDLIRLWVCGKLLEEENEKAQVQGSLIFEELLQRSLIEPAHADHGMNGGYVMHDLLHDFVMLLTEYEFILKATNLSFFLSDLRDFFNLGWFFNVRTHPQISNLRYNRISAGAKQEIPAGVRDLTCITNWEHLSCLDLKYTNIEMESFANLLGNLRYSELANYHVMAIPIEMMNLMGFGKPLPQNIGLLTNKRRISQFEVNGPKTYLMLGDLRGLVDPKGDVCITELSYVTSIKEAHLANLQSKRGIEVLRMDWSIEPYGSPHTIYKLSECAINQQLADVQEQLFEILKPHPGLKELHIYKYCGSKFPSWFGDPSFTALVKISLSGGDKSSVLLPSLCQLPSLKNLAIRSMSGLCRVGHEFCSVEVDKKGFQSLEKLEIDDMVNWSVWTGVKSGDFCCLNTIKIVSCPELMALPNLLSSSLKTLVIKDCNTLLIIPNLPSLAFLILAGEVSEAIFTRLDLPMLRALKVSQSQSIRCVHLNYEELPLLEVLLISGCRNLKSIVGLSGLSSLQVLKISWCKNMKFSLRQKLPSTLLHLDISYCPKLHQWKEIQGSSYYEQIYSDTNNVVLQKLSDLEEAEKGLMTTNENDLNTDLFSKKYKTSEERQISMKLASLNL